MRPLLFVGGDGARINAPGLEPLLASAAFHLSPSRSREAIRTISPTLSGLELGNFHHSHRHSPEAWGDAPDNTVPLTFPLWEQSEGS